MKNLFLLALITTFGMKLQAQTLSFELGYGKQDYNMMVLNMYIESYPNSMLFATETIQMGDNFHAGIKYRPHGAFEVGLIANFQQSSTRGEYKSSQNLEPGKYYQEIYVQSYGISISNTWYLSHLFGFQEKGNFLKRFHFGIDYAAGVGFFNMSEMKVAPQSYNSGSGVYTASKKFQGQAAVKFQYDYLNNPLIAAVGLKGGYQYLKSNPLEDKSGDPWIGDPFTSTKYPVNLDFSGWFVSAFLTIGK